MVAAPARVRRAPAELRGWWRHRVMLAGRISTTRLVLARLRLAMIGGLVLVLATSFVAFRAADGTVTAASHQTAVALTYVSAAQLALAKADGAMISGLVADSGAQSTQDQASYRDSLAQASRSLQQVSQSDQVGAQGTEDLLQVQGQLTVYSGLVQQAYIDYVNQADQDTRQFGLLELIYASKLMHSSGQMKHPNGILAALADLRGLEQDKLDAQVNSAWLRPWAALLWVVPAVAMLAVLWYAQRYLRRRFQRAHNGFLLAATVLLVVLCGCVGTIGWLEAVRLGTARHDLTTVLADRDPVFGPLLPTGPQPITAELNTMCGQVERVGCGQANSTVTDPTRLGNDGLAATGSAEAAANNYALEIVIPGLGLVIFVLVWSGIHMRIREYRYEAR